jgi:hypothetical protein
MKNRDHALRRPTIRRLCIAITASSNVATLDWISPADIATAEA